MKIFMASIQPNFPSVPVLNLAVFSSLELAKIFFTGILGNCAFHTSGAITKVIRNGQIIGEIGEHEVDVLAGEKN